MEMGMGAGMGGMMAAGGGAPRPTTLTIAQLKAQEAEKKSAQEQPNKKKGIMREAAGQRWRDPTLDEWPENDFRIFVGDMVSSAHSCYALIT